MKLGKLKEVDMSSIDLTKKIPNTDTPITAQSFVFSVSGEWVNSFTIQIEHTTNNPFTYTFYEGKNEEASAIFKNLANSGKTGYRVLALMNLADLQMGENKKAEVIKKRIPFGMLFCGSSELTAGSANFSTSSCSKCNI